MRTRDELHRRIAAKLTGVDAAEANRLAGEVVAMMYRVEDEWITHDVSTTGDRPEISA